MKKSLKQKLGAALSVTLMAAMVAGCGAKEQASTDSTQAPGTSGAVTSEAQTDAPEEIVTLKWYMSLNPIHPDTDMVIEKLNEYTREKIGVELDYTAIASPDYGQKMQTLINSGDYFDICFSAQNHYLQFSAKDAFLDITDLVPQYAKETYEFVPENYWKAISREGRFYGVPCYKEMGFQSGIMVNAAMAEEYGIDLSTVKSLEDFSDILKVVKEKSLAAGKDVIGIQGIGRDGVVFAKPYETLVGAKMPGASAVSEYGLYADQEEVFNQYATQEYMDYCMMVREWYNNGYLSKDPIQYNTDTAKRDNDFKNGKIFSHMIGYAPGAEADASTKAGFEVTYIPLMKPLFESKVAMGSIQAISSASKYPEKALEFINLVNTDEYVGTLLRHGIEGVHHTPVGDTQVDRTLGGTIEAADNGYDYVFGWQFGTTFNQKWDISYPEDIEEQFMEYNASSIIAPHNGFTFDNTKVETEIAAITGTVDEYREALESGIVDPQENIPKFLKALEDNGVNVLLDEVRSQMDAWKANQK